VNKVRSRSEVVALLNDICSRLAAGDSSSATQSLLADAQMALATLGHLEAAHSIGRVGGRILTEAIALERLSINGTAGPSQALGTTGGALDIPAIQEVLRELRLTTTPWYESKADGNAE
jgi:hypothetical protein